MTERKPISERWESFVERKIREAQSEGAFDSLAGFGRPIRDLDAPDDSNWWLKKAARGEPHTLASHPGSPAGGGKDTRGDLVAADRGRSPPTTDRAQRTHSQSPFFAGRRACRRCAAGDIEAVVREWVRRKR